MADLLTVGVIIGDPDGSAGFANRAWMRMTGQDEHEWFGHGWLRVLSVAQLDVERVALAVALERKQTSRRQWDIIHPDGRRASLAVSITPDLSDGVVCGFVATILDMTTDLENVQRLSYQATHDPLTGLLDRSQIYELLSHALDRTRREPTAVVALLFIDVDNLKVINDRHGHNAGDGVLRSLARSIRDAVRPVDVVVRYGGDEFVVLCEGLTGPDEASTIARRIISSAREQKSEGEPPITVSVGIAIADDPSASPVQVVHAADHAMYEAKQRGGGQHNVAGAR